MFIIWQSTSQLNNHGMSLKLGTAIKLYVIESNNLHLTNTFECRLSSSNIDDQEFLPGSQWQNSFGLYYHSTSEINMHKSAKWTKLRIFIY